MKAGKEELPQPRIGLRLIPNVRVAVIPCQHDVPSRGFGAGYGMGMARGMGMGMGWGMPGFGTSLDALRSAPDFDRAFIEQMIPHHRMGVMMASHAQWNTQHPQLRELEEAMVRVQSQEIEQMAQWYQQWYGSSAR